VIIIGDNLKELIVQHKITTGNTGYDVNSITLTLDEQIITIRPDPGAEVCYESKEIPEKWLKRTQVGRDGFRLEARNAVLGCSCEVVQMPCGYCGFVQTKGSLARLFVSVVCCDSQIEPGYSGKITFELCNLGNFPVRLCPNQAVAQLFIVRTSTRNCKLYNGRYQNAKGPTVSLPFKR